MLMLRLISHSYLVPRPHPAKALCIDLALGSDARDDAARRTRGAPAGGPVEPGLQRRHVVHRAARRGAAAAGRERRQVLRRAPARADGGRADAGVERGDARVAQALRILTELTAARRTRLRGLEQSPRLDCTPRAAVAAALASPRRRRRATAGAAQERRQSIEPGNVAPTPRTVDGVDYIEGRDLTLIYEGKKCIHSRFCVTWGPKVFIANVKGPWINPDAMPTEALAEIAHVCVSGAIRYKRKDGKPDEAPPPVNLISVREGGPYAVRADIRLDGAPAQLSATRCAAAARRRTSRSATARTTRSTSPRAASRRPARPTCCAVRDGPLAIDPLTDGPLQVRGNLEIISGTGRVVARVESGAAVPLRRQQHQAVLRRQPRARSASVRVEFSEGNVSQTGVPTASELASSPLAGPAHVGLPAAAREPDTAPGSDHSTVARRRDDWQPRVKPQIEIAHGE